MKTYLATLIFSIFLVSCTSNRSTIELENHFSNRQIKDLNKLTSFFTKEYLKSNPENFETSFKDMFKLVYLNGIDTLINQIDYQKQKQLYQNIPKTFKDIWMVHFVSKDNPYELMAPRIPSSFYAYFQDLSLNNKFAKVLFPRFELSGDFYDFYFANYVAKNFEAINYQDFNNQVIISLYYISLVDDNLRDENLRKKILERQRKIKEQFLME